MIKTICKVKMSANKQNPNRFAAGGRASWTFPLRKNSLTRRLPGPDETGVARMTVWLDICIECSVNITVLTAFPWQCKELTFQLQVAGANCTAARGPAVGAERIKLPSGISGGAI